MYLDQIHPVLREQKSPPCAADCSWAFLLPSNRKYQGYSVLSKVPVPYTSLFGHI